MAQVVRFLLLLLLVGTSNAGTVNSKDSPVTSWTEKATTPEIRIQCLNNDCNGSLSPQKKEPVGKEASGRMGEMGPGAVDGKKSVPKKGVSDYETGSSVARKGVEGTLGKVSSKKELDSPSKSKHLLTMETATTTPPPVESHMQQTTPFSKTLLVSSAATLPSTTGVEEESESTIDAQSIETTKESLVDTPPDPADGGIANIVVAAVLAAILTITICCLSIKKLEAIRRRRSYRRMNDFLIDGMYGNDV